MSNSTQTTETDWIKVSESLPAANDGEQANVIFCSPGWACAIVGLFTCDSIDGHQWAAYNQQTDRFHDWGKPDPELWLLMPQPPESHQ